MSKQPTWAKTCAPKFSTRGPNVKPRSHVFPPAAPCPTRVTTCATLVASLALAGCSSTAPVAYKGLSSAPQLHAAKDDEAPYQYRDVGTDFCRYTKLIIDPVIIYDGEDAQFGSVSQEDRKIVADYMQQKFAEILHDKYEMVTFPEPNALRLHLTLASVETSTPVISTLSHVSPIGLVVNGVRQSLDDNGTFFGSVSYAAELYDAGTGKLIYAYVTKQTPDALDATASFRYLDAAKEGVRIGARHLRDNLFEGHAVQTASTANGEVSCH